MVKRLRIGEKEYELEKDISCEEVKGLSEFLYINNLKEEIEQLKEENEQLRQQIQNYEKLISNSYVGIEETLDGFVGKYVIWENELQKYKNKMVIDDG